MIYSFHHNKVLKYHLPYRSVGILLRHLFIQLTAKIVSSIGVGGFKQVF